MRMKALAAALLLATWALPANAVTLTPADVGSTGTGTFNGLEDGQNLIPQLGASLSLTLVSIATGSNTWTFDYVYKNTTAAPFTASTGAVGFNTTPNLDAVAISGFFTGVQTDANISGGVNHLEFCAHVGSTCSGNSSLGLDPGQTGTGQIILSFGGNPGTISLTDFVNRYQEITGGNYHGASGIGFGGPTVFINPTAAVPGPVAGAGIPGLIAACMLLVGLNKRRKQRLLGFA